MHELAKVTLDNEMDLILAHKRSMKLAEISGLSLSAQTTFATAVSEVARNTIESGKSGCLILSVETDQRDKYIVASLKDEQENNNYKEGLEYAKRLVNKFNVSTRGPETTIELFYYISPSFKIDIRKLDEWRSLFRNEPAISPYEELKRKNEQLQELSERVQKSEVQYKTLTNSLPLIIFSMRSDGELVYANNWLFKYTGHTMDSLNRNRWKPVIHQDDYESFSLLFKSDITKGATIKVQSRLRNRFDQNFYWHQVTLSPFHDEKMEVQYWIGYIVDIHAQKVFEGTLKDNIELKETQRQLQLQQQKLERFNEELERSNHELQQFAYVASHDLQEPVRKLLFYSDYLIKEYKGSEADKNLLYLRNMHGASHRMRNLIQDVLSFSQINKGDMNFRRVDLNKVAGDALQDLEIMIEEKQATINVGNLPVTFGDERMMRQLFENIIGNALKYSKKNTPPLISVDGSSENGTVQLSFSDNGIGFNEEYLPKMFNLFQRLHNRETYEGTGLGLAICRKITDLHGGKIWAKGKEKSGATFFVSLPHKTSPD